MAEVEYFSHELWKGLLDKHGSYRRLQRAYLKGELTPLEERSVEHHTNMEGIFVALAIMDK